MSTVADVTPIDQGVDPESAVRVVLGVARLGEADLRGWWSSQGMNRRVRFALGGFHRTAAVVGAELALLSAIRRHQQILPRQTAVQLFSAYLPFAGWAQAFLAECKLQGEDGRLIEELADWNDVESAEHALAGQLAAIRAPRFDGATVTTAQLQAPVVSAGLLAGLAEGYLGQDRNLVVPYVDLAP